MLLREFILQKVLLLYSTVLSSMDTFFEAYCICARAGVEGHKTNHSLRATGTTAMYEAQVHVPEKLIQERTGHRSLKALRVL